MRRFADEVATVIPVEVIPVPTLRVPAIKVAALSVLVIGVLGVAACNPPIADDLRATAGGRSGGSPIFEDVTAAVGVDFVHTAGGAGELLLPEVMGSGVGLFDYDGDGDLDLYLVQGGPVPGAPANEAVKPSDRLWRNDLDGDQLAFTDVTVAVGLESTGYGMGIAVGDIDRDGDLDLYVTNLGPNQLWLNDEGRFRDVTVESGVSEDRWSVPAAFVDIDGDGWLDLFVGNYADFRYVGRKPCYSPSGARDYCSPLAWSTVPDRLFRNRGDGTFDDVTLASGVSASPGHALGVVVADFNADNRTDIYVANDSMPNSLWINLGGGRFEDRAVMAGSAVNEAGEAEASMGVDLADVDGDGHDDLFMTHLAMESNTLYLGDGTGFFRDATAFSRLGTPSWSMTGFGTVLADWDADGDPDLVVVNGAVKRIVEQVGDGVVPPLRQPNQAFENQGDGRFVAVSNDELGPLAIEEIGRGLAAGDLDNDGDVDFVLSNNEGPARVLLNRVADGRGWIGFEALPEADALGARLYLEGASGGGAQRVKRAGSYASSNDSRIRFAVAKDSASMVVVEWPAGSRERFGPLESGRYHRLKKGRGERLP